MLWRRDLIGELLQLQSVTVTGVTLVTIILIKSRLGTELSSAGWDEG